MQHRDVKPQNLLLVGGGVKVSDFGLAKLLEGSQASNTGKMTPAYAAPEFLEHKTSNHSDQYSLAVSYCVLRGGRLPFEGNAAQQMAGHLMLPPDLTMLPPDERSAVARALAKKPEARWPSCRAFVEVLAVASSSTAPPPLPLTSTVTRAPQPTARSAGVTWAEADEPASRPVWPWLAAGGAGVLALVIVLIVLAVREKPRSGTSGNDGDRSARRDDPGDEPFGPRLAREEAMRSPRAWG